MVIVNMLVYIQYLLHKDQQVAGHDGSNPSSSWPLDEGPSWTHHEPFRPVPIDWQIDGCTDKDLGEWQAKNHMQPSQQISANNAKIGANNTITMITNGELRLRLHGNISGENGNLCYVFVTVFIVFTR